MSVKATSVLNVDEGTGKEIGRWLADGSDDAVDLVVDISLEDDELIFLFADSVLSIPAERVRRLLGAK